VRVSVGLLTALFLAGCSKPETATGGDAANGVNPKPYVISASDRRTVAPALVGASLSGAPLTLASLHGKVVVLNFWASWCGPCRAEATVLASVSAATADHGVAFVGVDEKDSRGAAETFTRTRNISYPSAFDPDGALAASWSGAAGLPYTFVIDRRGKIATRVIGGVTEEELQTAVLTIAAEK
jgi:thiol-disulfide isomerase/thioredoxin